MYYVVADAIVVGCFLLVTYVSVIHFVFVLIFPFMFMDKNTTIQTYIHINVCECMYLPVWKHINCADVTQAI